MLVRFNKRTIVEGMTYAKDSEHDLANDLADQVVRDGNGEVVGLGAVAHEVAAVTGPNGEQILTRSDGKPFLAVAKAFVGTGNAQYFTGSAGTAIPTSTNPVGDYTTKLQFMGLVRDDIGTVVDMTNHRLIIPDGYSECRVIYNVAWAGDAVGWRGCRIKNDAGSNFGNVRILSVGASATTNTMCVTSWIKILPTGDSAIYAPNSIGVADAFSFWPAHTSTTTPLTCGADLASSFVQIELR